MMPSKRCKTEIIIKMNMTMTISILIAKKKEKMDMSKNIIQTTKPFNRIKATIITSTMTMMKRMKMRIIKINRHLISNEGNITKTIEFNSNQMRKMMKQMKVKVRMRAKKRHIISFSYNNFSNGSSNNDNSRLNFNSLEIKSMNKMTMSKMKM